MSTVYVEDIRTPRLDLIAITPALLRLELEGRAAFAAGFPALAAAEVAAAWPPQDWEPHVLAFVLRQITGQPETVGWTRFVALRDQAAGIRTLIGTVGAVPPGTEMAHAAPGEIEVGYGILPEFQRHGFATEAVMGMMDWVRALGKVEAFVAQTFPHLKPSMRVLEKSGFQPAGAGFEDGTILFRRRVLAGSGEGSGGTGLRVG